MDDLRPDPKPRVALHHERMGLYDRSDWPEWARVAVRVGILRRYALDRGHFLADRSSTMDEDEWMAMSAEAAEACALAKELPTEALRLRYGRPLSAMAIAVCPRCDQLYVHPIAGPRCPSCRFNLASSDTAGELR